MNEETIKSILNTCNQAALQVIENANKSVRAQIMVLMNETVHAMIEKFKLEENKKESLAANKQV